MLLEISQIACKLRAMSVYLINRVEVKFVPI